MIRILSKLTESDPEFPAKCHLHQDNIGTVRTYIARSTAELYPERPDLEELSIEFAPGWYVATNLSNQVKAKVIRMAFNVVGLTENVNARFSL